MLEKGKVHVSSGCLITDEAMSEKVLEFYDVIEPTTSMTWLLIVEAVLF